MRLLAFGRGRTGCGRAVWIVAATLALAACTTASDGPTPTLFGGTAPPAKKVYTAADFTADSYCPPIKIRGGTEALAIYDHAHDGDPDFLRYEASIGKTARECHQTGDTLSVKIGVAGNVVGGPKGSSGTVTLPIRVAVTKQMAASKPLFSQLYKQTDALAAPEFRADFSLVQEISFKVTPDDHDLIVYVGFDEGTKQGATKKD